MSPTYGPAAYHGIDKGPIAVGSEGASRVADERAFRTGVAPLKGVPKIIEKWRNAFGMGIPAYYRLIEAKKNC